MRAEDHRRDLTRDSEAGLIHSSAPDARRVSLSLSLSLSLCLSTYVKHVPRKCLNQFALPRDPGVSLKLGVVIVIDSSSAWSSILEQERGRERERERERSTLVAVLTARRSVESNNRDYK